MRRFKLLTMTVLATVILWSCKDGESSGNIQLSVGSSGATSFAGARSSSERTSAQVEITDFQISIRDVTFKMPNGDTAEVSFRGPYQLDLLNGTSTVKTIIGSLEVPNGNYEEVRFKFHKDEDLDVQHPLYDRSIYLAGTIDNLPFEMWHDTSENLDVGKTGGVTVDGNSVDLTVNFTIDQFLNSLHNIDLSSAVDGNEDGLIEINTNDPDGNKEIADQLKENIKMAADLL